LYRYPGNYGRYLELKEARIAAEDAEAMRARTKLRRESEWMAKQPRARQAKSKARQDQFYDLVDKAKGREADAKKIEFVTPEEKERQKRLGGIVGEFRAAKFTLGDKVLLNDFTYNFRQRDRIGVVGPNG
jgi:ATP-binding cassette subfamily F protein uup